MKFSKRTVLLVFLILTLIVLFLPIKVNYSFEATALIFPVREWSLKRGQDDNYFTELQNNKTNVVSNLLSYKFERGDVAQVQIKSGLVSGVYVTTLDTVAIIHSFFNDNEIIRLKNLKKIEESSLNVTITGEKQALIDQAKQKHQFALQQLALEQKNFDRQRKLYLDSIISQSEYEVYENQYQLAKINVEIAANDLLSLQTGAKTEEVNYIRQKIDAYQKEIEILEKLKNQYYIMPPLDGLVSFNRVIDGVITVSDTSQYILKIPVKLNNIQYLDRISSIKFSVPGYNEKISASFISIDENVNLNITSNQQLIIAKALIDGGVKGIYPGMAVSCKVYCDKITIFDFLRRGIHLKL